MSKKFGCAAVALALFIAVLLLVRTVDVAAIGPGGTSIGLSGLNGKVRDALGTHLTLYKITQLMGYASLLLATGFGALGLTQIIQRRSLKKMDRCLWALCGLYVAVAVLYVFFEKFIVNYRPVLMPGETEAEASFPSSHTMLFCVVLGSAALVAGRYISSPRLLWIVRAVCGLGAFAGVLWRLVSGVHWITDILAGLLISATLLLAFSGVLDRLEENEA